MKKIISILLLGCICISLVACETSDSDVNTDSETGGSIETEDNINKVSSNWKDYEFSINDAKLSLPCSYKDFESATGISLSTSKAESYIVEAEEDSSAFLNLYEPNKVEGHGVLSADFYNNSQEDKLAKDCEIIIIQQSTTNIKESNPPLVIFPGDIYVGIELTEDELEELLGEPQFAYSTEENKFYEYFYKDDISQYYIAIKDGAVAEISLSYWYYQGQ